ncbi:helix-turn-helix domain-containing protein [Anaerocolumna sp. AGMB13025]|uniref:winged helix-turn-helix transcriptional regulator n=1 Tax=Anaerocolumna sp. AGMB13025 TaxID=3039116 RepID=UPI00241D4F26|nr:helix-turn-helix domain-containing protein [Anaerocolumna sp. AGMB13025]WFR58808.1 helix-turn-helix domain-containing protein [Anaerocolumna sp. AGMB13025]
MQDITYKEYQEQVKNVRIDKDCGTYKTLEIFQGKWNIRVLFELIKHDTIRFGDLKKQIDEITNTMLTSTLRDLEKRELVNRVQFNEIPPHVEYSLSQAGKDLYPIFIEMMQWNNKYQQSPNKSREF